MLKYALAAGIVFEWIFGASIFTVQSLGFAVLRTICATLLAWMALEGVRVLFVAALSLDNKAPASVRTAPNRR